MDQPPAGGHRVGALAGEPERIPASIRTSLAPGGNFPPRTAKPVNSAAHMRIFSVVRNVGRGGSTDGLHQYFVVLLIRFCSAANAVSPGQKHSVLNTAEPNERTEPV